MSDQVNNSRSKFDERLLREKFGEWFDWEKPEIAQTVGPYDPEAFEAFSEHLENLIKKAKLKIETFSPEDLTGAENEDLA